MTKARNEYIYHLTGTIQYKTLTKASPKSQYAGNPFYNLTIIQENKLKKTIQVFPEKLADLTIWETITQGQCYQKKYLFRCRNTRGYYYLVDWEELSGGKE